MEWAVLFLFYTDLLDYSRLLIWLGCKQVFHDVPPCRVYLYGWLQKNGVFY